MFLAMGKTCSGWVQGMGLRNGWIMYYFFGAFFEFFVHNIFAIFAPVIRDGWEYWRGLVRIITRGEYWRGLVRNISYKNGFFIFFFMIL